MNRSWKRELLAAVSTLATVLEPPEPAASPAVNFTRTGRIAGAATIVRGATCQLVAFLTIPAYDDTVDRLQWRSSGS